MKITVAVKPNSKKEGVQILPDGSYLVRVNAPPTENKANKRVIELLSEFLDQPKSSIVLTSGQHGKKKVFQIS